MITKEIYEQTYPKTTASTDTIIVGAANRSGSKTSSSKSSSQRGASSKASAQRSSAGRSSATSRPAAGGGTGSANRSASAHGIGTAGKKHAASVRAKHHKTKRSKQRNKLKWLMLAVILLLALAMLRSCFATVDVKNLNYPDYIQQNFIGVDGHSRTGNEMSRVNDIVIHYVANPGSSAKANRDYFDSSQSQVSAHFVVGLKGEVIQCVPLDEESSASNQRNPDTISIEVCHPDSSGKFNDQTYYALVQLTAWLCDEFHLGEDHLIRHYDITGKDCPKYYVDHPDAWSRFKDDVERFR
ncbi:N-acetylmuramoyl-L-alanine amidase [Clostridiales bacterium]|nr:N-acetylmuramoyl-L-alanine amidase [Clostridiales bacterium]